MPNFWFETIVGTDAQKGADLRRRIGVPVVRTYDHVIVAGVRKDIR